MLRICSVGLLLGLALFLSPRTGLGAATPGGSFDLSHWKLTLPVDYAGGTNAAAAEVKNPQLQTYSSQFFYSGTDGAMTFWCPVFGATTSGATAPRTELRELINGSDSSVNWSATGTHILRGQCRVTQLPDTGAVIIGQVHGYPTQRLIKLQQDAGRVQVYFRHYLVASGDTKFTWNIPTNTLINYEIKVVDGVGFVAVNGVTNSFDFVRSDPAWLTSGFYFKAGAYLQDNVGPVTEGGRVSFYQLSVTHGTQVTPPAIISQPLSQTVAPGSNVTLTVGVSGTTPFTCQWRANGVNMPGRTNLSLPLTSFRATDEKGYDAIVANTGGAATSAVARLYLNAPVRFLESRVAAGRFTATLLGVAGSNYVVEVSTNLVTWSPLVTNSAPAGIVNFSAANPSSNRRFFRARLR